MGHHSFLQAQLGIHSPNVRARGCHSFTVTCFIYSASVVFTGGYYYLAQQRVCGGHGGEGSGKRWWSCWLRVLAASERVGVQAWQAERQASGWGCETWKAKV